MYDKSVAVPFKIDEVSEKRDNWMSDMTPDKYAAVLDSMAKFKNYSVNNAALIAMQRPDATFIASFDDWKEKFGRSINKGTKGIDFIKPVKVKKMVEVPGESGTLDSPAVVEKEFTNFKVISMFDVSDTHGKQLPAFITDELDKTVDDVARFKQAFEILTGVPCEYDDIKNAVMNMAKDKVTSDLEKYSVAYIICKHYGVGTAEFSFDSAADQLKGELKDIRSSLNRISKAAYEIISNVDEKIQGIKAAEKGETEISSEDTPHKDEDIVKPRDVKSLKESILEKLKGNKDNVGDRYKHEIKITGRNDMAI